MLIRFISFFLVISSLTGCDFIKKLTGGSTDPQAVGTQQPAADQAVDPAVATTPPAAPAKKMCPNGSEPKILAGDCSGEWKVTRVDKNLACEFAWGPTISCPEGTKPLGITSVCYGSTLRPLTSGQGSITPEKCSSQFGKYPQSPKYELDCCPG